ncbi:hypothetical protein KC367_g5557 [Hortaea werneckii]|nr:hypothetical protein KC367_g5557 [Hortaea werneckii]
MDTARAGIKVYLAHLQKFKDLAVRVTHLVEHLEKSWVRPGIEAGRNDLLPLRDIHRQRWREEMLQFDEASVGTTTGIDFLRHAGGLLLRPGQGWASDEDEELLRSLAGTEAPKLPEATSECAAI